ncbi:MAG: L-serine ammonia-lyase, iron-sulfur-dependent, subunit alpha [Oscillospiraceae bacterium]
MYNNIAQLIKSSESTPLYEVILNNEISLSGKTREEVLSKVIMSLEVMKKSAVKALYKPQSMIGGLISGQAERQSSYSKSNTLMGGEINELMASAFSCSEVNASMGRICAAPTAGACGILPSVLLYVQKRIGCNDEKLVQALLVASGFGAVIMRNATVSGAEGGCQAECGTAAAMAAAAAVYLAGGSAEMCANAAAIAIINCMGLICDPVAGLVQLPCSFRNASGSVNAIASADMALAGQTSVIPPDEVVEAMYRVGKSLPSSLRETAQGGIADTAKAREIEKQIK